MKSKHVKYDWVITRVLSFLEKTLKKPRLFSFVFLILTYRKPGDRLSTLSIVSKLLGWFPVTQISQEIGLLFPSESLPCGDKILPSHKR